MEGEATFSTFQRLHPLTLAYRLMVSLPGFVLLVLPVLRRGGDIQTWISLVLAVVYGVFTLPWIFLYYYRFTFRITPKEVNIHSGVLTRQRRSIPLERIQNVEIEQRLLQRMLGIARVRISTAGSAGAEGVLESVTVETARRVRQVIRGYQQQAATHQPTAEAIPPETALAGGTDTQTTESEASPVPVTSPVSTPYAEPDWLLQMPPKQVMLAGMFRFSLFYIAIFFSALQYLDIDPEVVVDGIIRWVNRGGLDAFQTEQELPGWVLGLIGLVLATVLAWISNIATTFNRYYGFKVGLDEGKIQKRHGLLTLAEDTIPLKRLQVQMLWANPLMRRFGWYRLELQTMGVQSGQQGRKVAAPLAQLDEALALAQHFYPFTVPETFQLVSRLTIRRAFVRYTVVWVMLLGLGAYLWPVTTWAWGLLMVPVWYYFAVLRYRNHGFALEGDVFFVRRGVWRHRIWIIPLEKIQVLNTTATIFQRRLGLQTLHIDTAGASGSTIAMLIDLSNEQAAYWLDTLYTRFQEQFTPSG